MFLYASVLGVACAYFFSGFSWEGLGISFLFNLNTLIRTRFRYKKVMMGFCAHLSDKSNVTASPLIRKGATVNQLQQNNQLIPMDLRIKVDIATAI